MFRKSFFIERVNFFEIQELFCEIISFANLLGSHYLFEIL